MPLGISIYERGPGGAPTTNEIDNVARIAESIEWSITDAFGFESCTVSFTGTPADLQVWFARLGCGIVVWGPAAERCWEGLLMTVEGQFGDERHSRSLEDMANRWDVKYTTANGVPLSAGTAGNTASQALYGVKDAVTTINTATATAAQQLRAQLLAVHSWPVRSSSSQLQVNSGAAQMTITLTFAGWYTTLDWVFTSRTDSTTEVTTLQVAALIGASSPGIGATNAFLSTSTARITASGISDTRTIDAGTTYRAKIEQLLAQGNAGGQGLTWGVYEGRTFVVDLWAGATPNQLDYVRWLSGYLTTPGGGIVDPWNVRPNRMCQVADMNDATARSAEQDAGGRFYVSRVTFRLDASGPSISLEPGADADLAARIARMGRAARG